MASAFHFTDALSEASPESVGFSPSLPRKIDDLINSAISDKATPGMAIAVGRHGKVVVQKAYGKLDWASDSSAVSTETLYDLASLTKVIGTTTALMILEEEGKIDLERTVASDLPEFNDPEKQGITLFQLLVHKGGMEAFAALYQTYRGKEQYLDQINRRPLKHKPGTVTEYSDWDLILAQFVLERVTGTTLDAFLSERVFKPLGMQDTLYNPGPDLKPRCAPTEIKDFRGGLIWGEVHDENAWAMGGVSGHAGLFSTVKDLALFAQMMLNGGIYNGVRIFKASTVSRWTARQSLSSSRALGWDTPSLNSSAGKYFSPRSFGHTGFTGTSIWIDPQRDMFVILLANRVNPTRENPKMIPLRRAVADAVQEAITDSPLVDWEPSL